VHIEASVGGESFSTNNRVNPEQYFDTKFDAKGNPVNPPSITDEETNAIVNFLNVINEHGPPKEKPNFPYPAQ